MAMSRRMPLVTLTASMVGLFATQLAVVSAGSLQPAESQPDSWQHGLLDRYCVSCHNGQVRAGDLVLDDLDVLSVHEAPATWETVVRKLRAGAMPPPSRPRPNVETYLSLIHI